MEAINIIHLNYNRIFLYIGKAVKLRNIQCMIGNMCVSFVMLPGNCHTFVRICFSVNLPVRMQQH